MNKSWLIISASEKLANNLREFGPKNQLTIDTNQYEIISILNWPAYLYRNYLFGSKRMLNKQQQVAILRSILHHDKNPHALSSIYHDIEEFMTFWFHYNQYILPTSKKPMTGMPQKMLDIMQSYQDYLTEFDLMDSSTVYDEISSELNNNKNLPILLFYGFKNICPQLEQHCKRLSQITTCYFDYQITYNQQQLLITAENDYIEKVNVAKAIKQLAVKGKTTIIVPDPSCINAWFETLYLFLTPEINYNEFSVQRIKPLIEFPVVAKAIFAIEILTNISLGITKKQIISLLKWQNTDTFFVKPTIDALMDSPYQMFTLQEMTDIIKKTAKDSLLLEWWQSLVLVIQTPKSKQTLPKWSVYFSQLLNHINWPFSSKIDSSLFQLLTTWKQTLNIWSTQDPLHSVQLSFQEAITDLRELLGSTPYQPKNAQDNKIEITTINQYHGMKTNCLIITQMSTKYFPATEINHPILNQWCETENGYPYNHPIEQLKRAKEQLQAWKHSADILLFSYAKQENTEILDVSPFVEDLLPFKFNENSSFQQNQPNAFQVKSKFLEKIYKNKFAGHVNSSAIKHQSHCSLKALYLHHIQIKSSQPHSQLSIKLLRGIIIHEILAELWTVLKDQNTLLTTSVEKLEDLVNDKVDSILYKYSKSNSYLLNSGYQTIEKRIIGKLIQQFLIHEKKRKPFKTIAIESPDLIHVLGQDIKVRYDRIDHDDTGYRLIDYKTGVAHPSMWLGKNPKDPQMLLYLLNTKHAFSSINYAMLNPKKIGYYHSDLYLQSLEKDNSNPQYNWDTFKQAAHQNITELVDAFLNKDAEQNPIDGIDTCIGCEFLDLCRINQIEESYA